MPKFKTDGTMVWLSGVERVKFWMQIEEIQSGCWIWTGMKNRGGYGLFSLPTANGGQLRRQVHHVSWWLTHQMAVPYGMELDHLCNVRLCANPDHLEVTTPEENARRRGERSLSCKRGHLWAAQVPIYNARGDGTYRICRICQYARNNAYERALTQKKKSERILCPCATEPSPT